MDMLAEYRPVSTMRLKPIPVVILIPKGNQRICQRQDVDEWISGTSCDDLSSDPVRVSSRRLEYSDLGPLATMDVLKRDTLVLCEHRGFRTATLW